MKGIRIIALAAAVAGLAACSDTSNVTSPNPSVSMNANARDDAPKGTTPGWYKGHTVTFDYSKPYFCGQPPTSGATSGCEIGADGQSSPRGGPIPTLYVMTPLGFDPGNLHCPTAGSCINHPSTLDASRVFGAGAENIPLPPHSHIVDDAQGGWWDIEVIGVTDPAVWSQVEAGKSLATVRALQAAGTGITGDIPSNLYLFFSVKK